jgi:hypothetical protein
VLQSGDAGELVPIYRYFFAVRKTCSGFVAENEVGLFVMMLNAKGRAPLFH